MNGTVGRRGTAAVVRQQHAKRRAVAASILLALTALLPQAVLQAAPTLDAVQLETIVRRASVPCNYLHPSTAEVEAAQQLFARTMRAEESAEALQQAWAALDFELVVHEVDGQQLWLLRESDKHRSGRGFYAFRPADALPIALEAPHSFADKATRRLASQLFLAGSFCAAAWNTVHRRTADLAHTDSSFLNAFTRAFVQLYREDAFVCQLHGFARAKRTTEAGQSADLILSNGSRSSPAWLHHAAGQFRIAFPSRVVRVYPVEVSELGATTNQQARLIHEYGTGRFLHLEMGAELRRQLVANPQNRTDYFKILAHTGRLTKANEG